MKQLIALTGRSNVGKTWTIKAVYNLLLDNHPELRVIVPTSDHPTEVRVVVSINGKTIGIESRGDTRKAVEHAQSIFAEHNCQIILCAARTKGGSWIAVKDFGGTHNYVIKRIKKGIERDVTQQIISNKSYTDRIIKDIEYLINGDDRQILTG